MKAAEPGPGRLTEIEPVGAAMSAGSRGVWTTPNATSFRLRYAGFDVEFKPAVRTRHVTFHAFSLDGPLPLRHPFGR
jgi:hypothetical protein